MTINKTLAARNKGGRPVALNADAATLKIISGLGEIQATTRECAAVLGVSHPTFLAFLQREQSAADTLDRGKERGRTSLRRTQFRLAQKNASMAIFLGKNYLDQTDKQDITASVKQDVQITDARSKIEHLISRQLAAIPAGSDPIKAN